MQTMEDFSKLSSEKTVRWDEAIAPELEKIFKDKSIMNMRIPKYLLDSDPLLTNIPEMEVALEVTNTEWTAEELESAERQVEQVLMEEAFIEACFEEMLEEEESQWYHYTVNPPPTVQYTTYMPNFQYITHAAIEQYPVTLPQGQSINSAYFQRNEQYTNDQWYILTSKLNPEAPEFIPRSVAS